MKKSSLLLASLLFAPFAIPAHAADDSKSDAGMAKMSKPHMKTSGKMMGVHKMSGTVAQIDHGTGMLTLKTGEGDLMLHFPPATVKGLNDGDTITVQLGYTKASGMKK